MSSLAQVFEVLNLMRDQGVVDAYAVGGATAMLFYAEPARTYDVDVFVLLREQIEPGLVSLEAVYTWARQRGFGVDAEHLMIHGVPVQLLPAFSPLVAEAITQAPVHDYDGVSVHVVGPEHLSHSLWRQGARGGANAPGSSSNREPSIARVCDTCSIGTVSTLWSPMMSEPPPIRSPGCSSANVSGIARRRPRRSRRRCASSSSSNGRTCRSWQNGAHSGRGSARGTLRHQRLDLESQWRRAGSAAGGARSGREGTDTDAIFA